MKTNKRQDLTEREYSFCYHYINTGNARDAAILAGYTTEPERKGMKLLANKNIKSKIDELYSEKKKNLCYKACIGYERLAFGNISEAVKLLCSDNVNDLPLDKMDLFNVSEIKKPKDGAMEIKFFDRLKALERLEQSNLDVKNDVNPFYYALEQGLKSLKSEERQD